jgi:hypothetical protein
MWTKRPSIKRLKGLICPFSTKFKCVIERLACLSFQGWWATRLGLSDLLEQWQEDQDSANSAEHLPSGKCIKVEPDILRSELVLDPEIFNGVSRHLHILESG